MLSAYPGDPKIQTATHISTLHPSTTENRKKPPTRAKMTPASCLQLSRTTLRDSFRVIFEMPVQSRRQDILGDFLWMHVQCVIIILQISFCLIR